MTKVNRKMRMGMIGGGKGAFIGGVHRMAANLDGEITLVCGAFSSDPQKSKESGEQMYLPPERVYGTYQEMIDSEKELSEGERMDFVSIVTPNHMHFAPAKYALENGFPVVIDKPLAFSFEESQELLKLVKKTGLLFGLTHTYTGYPMIKEAKELIKSGKLGKIRRVVAEYQQGWLSTKLEDGDQKQADWRTDPTRSGKAGCMGDIGTHAENLAEYVTGLKVKELCADLTAFVEGRRLDDDGNVLLRFDNGAKGVLFASQVAAGVENAIRLRVYGELGGLEWSHEDLNTLVVRWLDKPAEILRTGVNYSNLSERSLINTRVPAGHPEGYLEAFANIYKNFAKTLKARMNGESIDNEVYDFPTVEEGVRGMAFIDAVVESSAKGGVWVKIAE